MAPIAEEPVAKLTLDLLAYESRILSSNYLRGAFLWCLLREDSSRVASTIHLLPWALPNASDHRLTRRAALTVTEWLDEARRGIGRACDAIGFGPQETPYRVAAEFRGARLRAYFRAGNTSGPVLLIIPAPYKQPYVWDLSPDLSVVRRCVGKGLRVYLLEWLAPTKAEDSFGLAE